MQSHEEEEHTERQKIPGLSVWIKQRDPGECHGLLRGTGQEKRGQAAKDLERVALCSWR